MALLSLESRWLGDPSASAGNPVSNVKPSPPSIEETKPLVLQIREQVQVTLNRLMGKTVKSPRGVQYRILEILESGTNSTVFKVSNAAGECFAAKISSIYSEYQEREERIITHLCRNQGQDEIPIIKMIDGFYLMIPYTDPQSKKQESFKSRCTIYELLGADLHRDRLVNHSQYSIAKIEKIVLQILKVLQHLSKNDFIHGDLKPANILLTGKSPDAIKVCDFGLAFKIGKECWIVQTREYRAPEVVLEKRPYTPAIDMWSLGVILVELYSGRPFDPYFEGRVDDQEILKRIISVLGNECLQAEAPHPLITEEMKNPIKGSCLYEPLRFPITHKDELFFDLIERMLQWDPRKRITAQQALEHKFFATSS